MFKNFKKTVYVICYFLISTCWSQNHTSDSLVVNFELNEQYLNTIKVFKGKLDKKKYSEIKALIENELNTKIPEGKSILINYTQKAPNCLEKQFSDEVVIKIIENKMNISSRMCEENNAVNFFVFSEDSFFRNLYERKKQFRLDSGFFHNTIFTLHENCSCFFLLKPNGKFYKYYGSDYFSEVKKYL